MPIHASSRSYHKILLSLLEATYLEMLVTKGVTYASEQVEYPPARELFDRWARDSDAHCETCQYMIASFVSLLSEDCRSCMKDVVATSHNWARTLGLLGMGRGTLSKKELYALSKKYLMIESEGERKFAEMAAMTDDEQIKSMLVEISETKREHHKKARKFIDMLERTHDEVVKEI